jgi:hypothetical protein
VSKRKRGRNYKDAPSNPKLMGVIEGQTDFVISTVLFCKMGDMQRLLIAFVRKFKGNLGYSSMT